MGTGQTSRTVGKKYTATTSQTMGQKKAQGALATGAPFELGPGARARRPAARARRLKTSTLTEALKPPGRKNSPLGPQATNTTPSRRLKNKLKRPARTNQTLEKYFIRRASVEQNQYK